MARKYGASSRNVRIFLRERRRLVRADGHGHPEAVQRLQRRLHVGQDRRFLAADLVVSRFEGILHAARNGIGVEGAAKKRVQSVADEIADARRAQLVQAMLATGEVDGLGQGGVRIDERSVEIE